MVLKNFLKDSIESKNPDTRLAAVQKLDASNAENQKRLGQLAGADPDLRVRMTALKKMTDPVLLSELVSARVDVDEAEASALSASLASALASSELDKKSIDRMLGLKSDSVSLAVACHASDESVRHKVIASFGTQEMLSCVVLESRYHSSRMLAAEKLENPQIIAQCAGQMRSRDKIVSRLLQDRINAQLTLEKQREARKLDISQTLVALQNLSTSVWAPGYQGRLTALGQRWEQIEPTPDPHELAQYKELTGQCQAVARDHEDQQQILGYCADAVVQLNQLIEELKTTPYEVLEAKLAATRQRAVDANGAWRISVEAAQPDPAISRDYENARKQIHELQLAADKLLGVMKSLPVDIEEDLSGAERCVTEVGKVLEPYGQVREPSGEAPGDSENSKIKVDYDYQFMSDVEHKRLTIDARIRQQRNIDNDRIKSVHKQLSTLGGSITDGKWSLANSLYKRVEKKIGQLSFNPEYKSLGERLSRHKIKLDELADWQDFAAKPKLEALCDEMEKLAVEQQPAQEQGKQLKRLQQNWKALGPSRVASELWPRFKEASDKAYEPVGEYVKAKQTDRDQKASNKQAVCERLERYLGEADWQNPDWKSVEKTIRQAKTDWKKNRVTDRKPDKKLEDRFTGLVTRFNEKLDAEYDENEKIKQELIEKVTKLSDAEVSQHTINQTRRLQNAWKSTGIMRRKRDQELWEIFNGHCREIHKKYGALKKEKADSENEHVQRARVLIREIKALSQSNNPDENKFQTLQEEFSTLPEFPEKDKRGLQKDFNRVSQQFSRQRDASAKNHARAEMEELERLSGLCNQYELLVGQDSVAETKLDELNSEWDSSEVVLPRKWASAIQNRRDVACQHIAAQSKYDFDKTEKARRLACIQMEILSGKETPAEDRALRMEIQLAQLQQGMGSAAVEDASAERQEKLIEWLCMPPVPEAQRDKLESRFRSCF